MKMATNIGTSTATQLQTDANNSHSIFSLTNDDLFSRIELFLLQLWVPSMGKQIWVVYSSYCSFKIAGAAEDNANPFVDV